MSKIAFLVLATVLLPACAFAVDGVILINQSTVAAAGGFPYTIAQPGSYKLSGNLVVPGGLDGIRISASNVTLDLNGFTISAGQPVFGQSTNLIRTVASVSGITVRNGTVFGSLTTNLINFLTASGTVLEALTLYDAGGGNLSFFGSSAVVRGVSNPQGSIAIGCPAVVSDTLAFNFLRDQGSSTKCTFGFVSGNIL